MPLFGPRQTPSVGLLYSGGLDSAILLAELLRTGQSVQPFYVRTGMFWEEAELHAARAFIHAVMQPEAAPAWADSTGARVCSLVTLDMPVADLLPEHWSITGQDVPDNHSPDEAVYLPGRNPLLLIKAAVWCQMHGIAQLALAPLAGNPFPDATPEFLAQFGQVLSQATGTAIALLSPFRQLHKPQVMQLGRGLPLGLTFSCIRPEQLLHCGACNKCAERQAAFAQAGMADPTRYA